MNLPDAITRKEMYYSYLTGTGTEYPEPITREEQYLYYLCENGGIGGGGSVTEEQVQEAVNAYLTENPVQAGATEEQASQILQNKDDIVLLRENTYSKSEIDAMISNMLTGDAAQYKRVMRAWFEMNGAADATPAELTALCDRWYTITRTGWDGATEFYQPDVSAVSVGERLGDNVGLTCEPSTDAVAGQDDYAGLPLFACVDCNWKIDVETLEPVVTAIDGISDDFTRNDPDIYVGVLQMSGFHWWIEGDDTYTHGYCDTAKPYANLEPVPESVRVDGSVRPWVVHAKYMSHTTAEGKMSSCSGLIPTAFLSHNTLHTLSAKNGAQYSGTTTADDSWLKLMMLIKYASLTLDGIIQGCCNANYQYYALVAEAGVKRILITTAQAANLEAGMSVLLGNYTTSVDRGTAGMYSITGQAGALITGIETVTIDGTDYGAVYVDTEATFDTAANGSAVAGTTYISSFHWITGKTDGVLGNDGSPASNTSGKYPGKLQGIEFMNGGYEIIADVILSLYSDDDGVFWYEPYIALLRANQSASISANYKATGVKCEQPATAAWMYIKKLGYANGVFFPILVGGSSTTYTRDAFYMNAATAGTREWLARGHLNNGVALAGLSCLYGTYALSSSYWCYLSRLSASGNRGEWAA